MTIRWNPPPNWPEPPAGWSPPPGWQPDPAWPASPAGWVFWVEEDHAPRRWGKQAKPPTPEIEVVSRKMSAVERRQHLGRDPLPTFYVAVATFVEGEGSFTARGINRRGAETLAVNGLKKQWKAVQTVRSRRV